MRRRRSAELDLRDRLRLEAPGFQLRSIGGQLGFDPLYSLATVCQTRPSGLAGDQCFGRNQELKHIALQHCDSPLSV